MHSCLDQSLELQRQGQNCVLITVAATRGSAPRAAGTHMLVTVDQVLETIGGGNLEYQAIAKARAMLAQSNQVSYCLERYVLGADMGQCCGGLVYLHFAVLDDAFTVALNRLKMVYEQQGSAALWVRYSSDQCDYDIIHAELNNSESKVAQSGFNQVGSIRDQLNNGQAHGQCLWFESQGQWLEESVRDKEAEWSDYCVVHRLLPPQFRVVIFGAGHVGRALVHVLHPIADEIIWCDEREQEFPTTLPSNVKPHKDDPFTLIQAQSANTYYLIMTHNHSLDMLLVDTILKRKDAAYCGLIGSAAKRRRFEHVLSQQGLSEMDLKQLICPIGVAGIKDKQPAAIAVAVAAELLQSKENLQG